jgi:hypothetical protein
MQIIPQIEDSWLKELKSEFKKTYYKNIIQKIENDIKS